MWCYRIHVIRGYFCIIQFWKTLYIFNFELCTNLWNWATKNNVRLHYLIIRCVQCQKRSSRKIYETDFSQPNYISRLDTRSKIIMPPFVWSKIRIVVFSLQFCNYKTYKRLRLTTPSPPHCLPGSLICKLGCLEIAVDRFLSLGCDLRIHVICQDLWI